MTMLTAAPAHTSAFALPNIQKLATHCYYVTDVKRILASHAAPGARTSVSKASALGRIIPAGPVPATLSDHQRGSVEGTRYIINLRVLLKDIKTEHDLRTKAEMMRLYDWLSRSVASHLSNEFKDCDPDCEDEAKAKIALEKRITSKHEWETTDVAVCVSTDLLTGRQTLAFVGTAGLREFDNPELRHEGKVWFGDYVIAPGFRGTGDSRAMYFIVNARAADYLDELPKEAKGKVRLFTEPHNDALYELLGSERGGDHTIANMDKRTAWEKPYVTVRIRYVNPQQCFEMMSRMRISNLRKGRGSS